MRSLRGRRVRRGLLSPIVQYPLRVWYLQIPAHLQYRGNGYRQFSVTGPDLKNPGYGRSRLISTKQHNVLQLASIVLTNL